MVGEERVEEESGGKSPVCLALQFPSPLSLSLSPSLSLPPPLSLPPSLTQMRTMLDRQ